MAESPAVVVPPLHEPKSLVRYGWLSVATALATIALKLAAWWLTASVGLLSDAMESLVNLAAAIAAVVVLKVAAEPPDDEHHFGHGKVEYFSSGFEGALIFVAAVAIIWTAVERLLHPRVIEQAWLGLAVSAGASVVNFVVARVLFAAGKKHRSITLEADGHHLLTDVWTSIGVLVGVGLVALTGWQWLDPVVAILVALNIVRTGVDLVRRSTLGLLDTALPTEDQKAIDQVLKQYTNDSVQFHAVRSRQAGARRFVYLHLLVPGDWTVEKGHALSEKVERDLRALLPGATIFTHLESLNDPASFEDLGLDRH